MIVLYPLVAYLGMVAVLVTVHELGHYWAARLCGVKVLRFSVGMGKVILSRRFGPDQTEWALSAFPIGGYVKMLDAREQGAANIAPADLPREFTRQSVWKRMIIVAAGPGTNFLLAIALFTGIFMHGVPEAVPRLAPPPAHSAAFEAGLRGGEKITSINGEPVRAWSDVHWQLIQLALARQPARMNIEYPDTGHAPRTGQVVVPLDGLSSSEIDVDFMEKLGLGLYRSQVVLSNLAQSGVALSAGLHDGDIVQRVNGNPVGDGNEFVEAVRHSPGKPVDIDGMRGGEAFHIRLVPATQTEGGKSVGKIGAGVETVPSEMTVVSDALPGALYRATRKTWETSALTLKTLGKMVMGRASWKNITGPITTADYAGRAASIGALSYLGFLALISVSLGIMNLLPIPVLDGGLLLYYSLEVLTGRPVSERFGEIAQRAGIGILMALMIVAVFNDIARLGS